MSPSKRSTWPPAMPRLPLFTLTEDGDPMAEPCRWHADRLAVVRVPTAWKTRGQRWEPVCQSCADQCESEWRSEL